MLEDQKFAVGRANGRAKTVALTRDQILVGRVPYPFEDVVGASIVAARGSDGADGCLTIHSYPRKSGCCSGGGGERYYAPLSLYHSDREILARWHGAIERLCRGLPVTGDAKVPTRRMRAYINPRSGAGNGPAMWASAKPMLVHAGITCEEIITSRAGQVSDEIKTLDLSSLDGIIIVSGDGLVFELINGLMSRRDWEQAVRLPFGVLPGGSGNGLSVSMTHASGEPKGAMSSAFLIAKGMKRDLDMVSFSQRGLAPVYGMLSLSWGLISDIDLNSECCRCCGGARFTCYAIYRVCCMLRYRAGLRYVAAADDAPAKSASGIPSLRSVVETKGQSPVICEQPSGRDGGDGASADSVDPEIGAEEKWVDVTPRVMTTVWAMNVTHPSEDQIVAPDAMQDDGVIQLEYLEGGGRCGALCGLLRMDDGTHFQDPNFKCKRVSKFVLSPDCKYRQGLYSLDGEPSKDHTTPILVQVHPRVLRTFCAGGAPEAETPVSAQPQPQPTTGASSDAKRAE